MGRAAYVGFACAALALAAACGPDRPRDSATSYGAPVARALLVDGWRCSDAQAGVLAVPDHCAWPPALARARILTADVQLVTRVDARGAVVDVRVVRAPPDGAFDEAAIACARKASYRPAKGDAAAPRASDTCPLTLRLARYVTDLEPTQRDTPCAPSLNATSPGANSSGSQDSPQDLRCP